MYGLLCVCEFRYGYTRYFFFFFQAEDGIRDLVRSRGLGDVYKRQGLSGEHAPGTPGSVAGRAAAALHTKGSFVDLLKACLLYTSDAADDLLCVDLGGRRIIKKKIRKNNYKTNKHHSTRE